MRPSLIPILLLIGALTTALVNAASAEKDAQELLDGDLSESTIGMDRNPTEQTRFVQTLVHRVAAIYKKAAREQKQKVAEIVDIGDYDEPSDSQTALVLLQSAMSSVLPGRVRDVIAITSFIVDGHDDDAKRQSRDSRTSADYDAQHLLKTSLSQDSIEIYKGKSQPERSSIFKNLYTAVAAVYEKAAEEENVATKSVDVGTNRLRIGRLEMTRNTVQSAIVRDVIDITIHILYREFDDAINRLNKSLGAPRAYIDALNFRKNFLSQESMNLYQTATRPERKDLFHKLVQAVRAVYYKAAREQHIPRPVPISDYKLAADKKYIVSKLEEARDTLQDGVVRDMVCIAMLVLEGQYSCATDNVLVSHELFDDSEINLSHTGNT